MRCSFEEREAFLRDGHAHYHLDKSFHYHCRVFVEQAAEGPIRYKELRIYRGEEKNLQVDGLRDARVTIFPSREALRRGAVKIRNVNVYAIPDPTSEDELAKRSKTRAHARSGSALHRGRGCGRGGSGGRDGSDHGRVLVFGQHVRMPPDEAPGLAGLRCGRATRGPRRP